MTRTIAALCLLALPLIASAQTCTPARSDLITVKDLPPNGIRSRQGIYVDNAGGTFGGVGLTYTFNGAAGTRIVVTDVKDAYWFFKFESRECWNALGYNAFEFDFQAPVGSDFSMTLTVHTSACLRNNCTANSDNCPRQPDSTYVPISSLGYVPNGRMQHAVVPFDIFNDNSFGNGTTDFRYIKDFTFIQFTTANQPYIFNNFIVKAGCRVPTTTRRATTTAGLAGTTTRRTAAAVTIAVDGTGTGGTAGIATPISLKTSNAMSKMNSTPFVTLVLFVFALAFAI